MITFSCSSSRRIKASSVCLRHSCFTGRRNGRLFRRNALTSRHGASGSSISSNQSTDFLKRRTTKCLSKWQRTLKRDPTLWLRRSTAEISPPKRNLVFEPISITWRISSRHRTSQWKHRIQTKAHLVEARHLEATEIQSSETIVNTLWEARMMFFNSISRSSKRIKRNKRNSNLSWLSDRFRNQRSEILRRLEAIWRRAT